MSGDEGGEEGVTLLGITCMVGCWVGVRRVEAAYERSVCCVSCTVLNVLYPGLFIGIAV